VYPSTGENARGYLLSEAAIEWFRTHLRAACDLTDRALSPLFEPDLSELAPALIITAGFDPLRDEGLAYAARLREAGVPTRTLHYADQIHGFVSFDRVLFGARDALERVAGALREALTSGRFVPESEKRRVVEAAGRRSAVSPDEVRQRLHEVQVAQLVAAEWAQRQARSALVRALQIVAGP
jgi:acetyl esterase